jgi:hypothetical protein
MAWRIRTALMGLALLSGGVIFAGPRAANALSEGECPEGRRCGLSGGGLCPGLECQCAGIYPNYTCQENLD